MSRPNRFPAGGWALLCALPVAGCLNNQGLEPPVGELHYPSPIRAVDLVADAASSPTHLLVASINFDLKYNGSTLQSYDLDVANAAIDQTCGGLADPTRCAIVPVEAVSGTKVDPGALTLARVEGLLTSEVVIGSFSEGMEISPDGTIAYLPNGSDADITYVSLGEGGVLSCGGEGRHRCDATHRFMTQTELRGDDEVPISPLDLHVGNLSDFGRPAEEGTYALLLDRSGAVTFLTHDGEGTPLVARDVLEANAAEVLARVNYVTISRDPTTGLFFTPSASSIALSRVGLALDAQSADPLSTQLYRGRGVPYVGLNSRAPNVRQVVVDPRTSGPYAGRIYAVASSPEALIAGRIDARSDLFIEDVVDLGGASTASSQPARAAFVEIGGRYVLAVTTYQGRDVYFIDADTLRVIAVIRGFSGPFELAFDVARERLYISDFRVSVIRFVDLRPLFDCVLDRVPATPERSCSPRLIGMMGIPNAVQQL